jgi:hypothetical protein
MSCPELKNIISNMAIMDGHHHNNLGMAINSMIEGQLCSIFFGYMLSFINSYLITRIHVKGPGNKNFHYQDEGIKQFLQILLTRSQTHN